MIDSVQVILFIIILVLTILIVFLGVQVYFILRELRNTIMKANRILDDAANIADSVSRPLSSLVSFATSMQAGSLFAIFKMVRGIMSKDKSSHKERREENGS